MIKKLRLNEKSNFDSITKAADYYYPRWKSEVMDTYQIRDELERLGHNEDFIDAVIDLILDKYDDDQRYWDEYDDYDESILRKSKSRKLKEDSWDDIVNPSIEKRYIWPLYEDSVYEITEIIEKYQNSNRFENEIKSFDFKDIEYIDWPALQLELVCSYEVYVLIQKDLEREGLYMDDDEFDESLHENKGQREISYRIDTYGSWDNGHVLHSYKKGTLDDAEEAARKASMKDKDNLYYVLRDNIMDPTTDCSWYRGKKYHYSDDKEELNDIKREINNRR